MMSKEKRRVPKLRFPGFTEDWEQRKLGDVAIITGGGTPSTNVPEYWNGDIDWYSPVEIGKNRYVSKSTRKITKLGLEKSSAKLLPIGTVLFTSRAGIGNTAILQAEGCTNQGFQSITPDSKELDTYFLYTMTPRLKRYGEVTGAGSTFVEVSGKQMEKMSLVLPSLEEQKQIGRFFRTIDDSITLHQRKLNNLKLKKKALLQKLFPKNEERYPELRFPGFTDAWEQCKLSVLATMNARIGWQNLRTSEFLDNGDYLLITGTDFDNGRIKYSTCHYVEKKRFDQDTKIQLSTGSILITKDGTLGKVALVEELPKPATLNAGVFNVRVKDDAFLSYKYLYHYLKAPFLMKYVTANATGGTIKHLNQSILVDFPIPITGKQEQDRIAKLLDSLESIITLHQRKLDHLQLQKKALLQQMFV